MRACGGEEGESLALKPGRGGPCAQEAPKQCPARSELTSVSSDSSTWRRCSSTERSMLFCQSVCRSWVREVSIPATRCGVVWLAPRALS